MVVHDHVGIFDIISNDKFLYFIVYSLLFRSYTSSEYVHIAGNGWLIYSVSDRHAGERNSSLSSMEMKIIYGFDCT